jgi:hypothetical protein
LIYLYSLTKNHTMLRTVALWYVKSGSVSIPLLFFLVTTLLVVSSLLSSHINFKISFKHNPGILMDCIKFLNQVMKKWHLNNTDYSNSWTQNLSPFIQIVFDFLISLIDLTSKFTYLIRFVLMHLILCFVNGIFLLFEVLIVY